MSSARPLFFLNCSWSPKPASAAFRSMTSRRVQRSRTMRPEVVAATLASQALLAESAGEETEESELRAWYDQKMQRILADATPAADSEQLKNNTGYDAGATARSLKKVECSAQFGCLCPHLLTCTGWVGQVTRRQGIDTRDNKTSKSLNLTPRTFSGMPSRLHTRPIDTVLDEMIRHEDATKRVREFFRPFSPGNGRQREDRTQSDAGQMAETLPTVLPVPTAENRLTPKKVPPLETTGLASRNSALNAHEHLSGGPGEVLDAQYQLPHNLMYPALSHRPLQTAVCRHSDRFLSTSSQWRRGLSRMDRLGLREMNRVQRAERGKDSLQQTSLVTDSARRTHHRFAHLLDPIFDSSNIRVSSRYAICAGNLSDVPAATQRMHDHLPLSSAQSRPHDELSLRPCVDIDQSVAAERLPIFVNVTPRRISEAAVSLARAAYDPLEFSKFKTQYLAQNGGSVNEMRGAGVNASNIAPFKPEFGSDARTSTPRTSRGKNAVNGDEKTFGGMGFLDEVQPGIEEVIAGRVAETQRTFANELRKQQELRNVL